MITIGYEEEIRKILTVKVPHNLYELFIYENWEECRNTATHYSMYHLEQSLEDIDDYELADDEIEQFKEYYDFASKKFSEDNYIIKFVDEDYE